MRGMPLDQYALIENALAADEGVGPDALRGEIAALDERFNRVAGDNPEAAFPTPMTADELSTFSPADRPLPENRREKGPVTGPFSLGNSGLWDIRWVCVPWRRRTRSTARPEVDPVERRP